MEKYLEYSANVIKELKEYYKTCDFHFQLIHSNINISVFFVLAESSVFSKQDLWERISKEIALKYQSKLETTYEKWNLYIIYITNDITPKELKNRIENDRFSSRKIVEDSYANEFNSDKANELIVKHITNTDLKDILNQTQDKIQIEYKPVDEELWKLVHDDALFTRDTDLQKQIIEQISKKSNEN